MTLTAAALLVSLGIALFCVLPFLVPVVRANSKWMMMVGTVVLLGFVAFDLVPETYEVGGVGAIVMMLGSFAFFTGMHALTSQSHTSATHIGDLHNHEETKGHHGLSFLLGSMAIHCFAGGMLLVSSYSISEHMAHAVVLSLVAHKGFEAVSVTSLLMDRARSRRHFFSCAAIYIVSFPLGVLLTVGVSSAFEGVLSVAAVNQVAMVITSIAIGSLFGCLLQDFLLPSLKELRTSLVRVPG